MTRLTIPAVLARGGASRGLLLHAEDLERFPPQQRDRLLARLVGSPDPTYRQADGAGGGNVTTSKVASVGRPSRADCDVDYTYHQVDVASGEVDRRGTCGNLVTAVGQFAVDSDLVRAIEPLTRVRVHDVNTGHVVWVEVPVESGRVRYHGDVTMGGVPGTGAGVVTTFLRPAGAVTGTLYPSGSGLDRVATDAGTVRVTLIDVVNPVVLVHHDSLGRWPGWQREDIMGDGRLLTQLEEVRRWSAVRCGLAESQETAGVEAKALPFVGVLCDSRMGAFPDLGLPQSVTAAVRMLSGGLVHGALPLSAAMATAVAVGLRGPQADCPERDKRVVLGHASGTLTIDVGYGSPEPDQATGVERVSVVQTGRPIMSGHMHIPADLDPTSAAD
ncbi:PrpF domain-containing protein [Rhizomonospora bruguierae]|uniref:PrpF domain-containing protein n=1 Tax=Rhizomonospora bruguierae TaxID=1581705 RepID=UPI001BCC5505|nr:PrpF domain-containing protein [Micromonospora sp. NBRC 107566]